MTGDAGAALRRAVSERRLVEFRHGGRWWFGVPLRLSGPAGGEHVELSLGNGDPARNGTRCFALSGVSHLALLGRPAAGNEP